MARRAAVSLLLVLLAACSGVRPTLPWGRLPIVTPTAARPAYPAYPGSSPPTATPSPPPAYPPGGSPPPATPLPLCPFRSQPPATAATSLDAYQFAAPRAVYTDTSGALLRIEDWLPDSRRLLAIRRPADVPTATVGLVDVRSGTFESYGAGSNLAGLQAAVWLAPEQAVAYTAQSGGATALYIARGGGAAPAPQSFALAEPALAASGDGHQLLLVPAEAGGQPWLYDLGQRALRALPLRVPRTGAAPANPLQFAWQPGGTHVVLFTAAAGIFLGDLSVGQVCQVRPAGDLPGLSIGAYDARWSPDGRYLALVVSAEGPGRPSLGVWVLDASAGEQRRIALPGSDVPSAVTWAPDGRTLLIRAAPWTGQEPTAQPGAARLYLADAATGSSRQLPAESTGIGATAAGLAWSPDGHTVALACARPGEATPPHTVCLLEVSAQR